MGPSEQPHEQSAAGRDTRILREAEAVYGSLVDLVPGALYVAEAGMHGRWLYVSPQIQRLLGYAPAEWLADQSLWFNLLHPDDREAQVSVEEHGAVAPGSTHESEYRLHTRDGEVRWFRDVATLVADEEGHPWVWSGVLTDITAQKQAEEALRRSHEHSHSIIATARDAYVAIDVDGLIVEWNRMAEEIFGWSQSEVLGTPVTESIIPPAYREAHRRGVARAMTTGDSPTLGRTMELSARHRDGHEFPVELTVWQTTSDDGPQFNAFLRNITERVALQQQLTHQAFHDALTGLANRALFTDRVDRATAGRNRSGCAVLFVDLDDFKAVNDSLGHAAGDAVLIGVGERLAACVRAEDSLARVAGDEFAVLLEGVDDIEPATALARRMLDQLREPFAIGAREVIIRASIGVAWRDAASQAPGIELIRDADVAMYQAKRAGKGRVAVFESGMRADVVRRAQLTADLRSAVERREITVHYQPYLDLHDCTVVGLEALARWDHRGHGWVSPGEFIELAEGTGLIRRLGRLVLESSCEQVAAWRRTLPSARDLSVSVNLSAHQLEDVDLVPHVLQVLDRTGLPPAALMLEITESAFLRDTEQAAKRLAALRTLGVRLAVDDFGTRYASLSYLQRFPVDTLKVDRSFVAKVDVSADHARMAGAIVQFAHTLGLRTIAEGVEHADQVTVLRDLGCGLGQGYHFARPAPAAEVPRMLSVAAISAHANADRLGA